MPEGPLAGRGCAGAVPSAVCGGRARDGLSVAALSIGRGNAKTALTAGLALGALLGEWDQQPRREIPIAARTRDQARIAWNFVAGVSPGRCRTTCKGSSHFAGQPRYEIEFAGDGGGHVLRAIAADGKSALGMAPTFASWTSAGTGRPIKATSLSTRCCPASASAAAGR